MAWSAAASIDKTGATRVSTNMRLFIKRIDGHRAMKFTCYAHDLLIRGLQDYIATLNEN